MNMLTHSIARSTLSRKYNTSNVDKGDSLSLTEIRLRFEQAKDERALHVSRVAHYPGLMRRVCCSQI